MSLKGNFYKTIINTFGKNSTGITLAEKYGLNSAQIMDYIYRKDLKPTGTTFLGKCADSLFLNFPTWASIRKRKQNLQNILYCIIKGRLERESDKGIKILDLASGYSQYIFAVLDKLDSTDKIYVEMRDKDAVCEDYIYSANSHKGYNIKFVQSDITSEEDYDFNNIFDIVILTGFYDSLDINDVQNIEKTMGFVSRIMNPDAVFIYSYQASHVDVSLVNELFYDTNDTKLSMGERKKIDIQYLNGNAGFKIIGQIADSEGRYPLIISAKTDAQVDFIKKVLTSGG